VIIKPGGKENTDIRPGIKSKNKRISGKIKVEPQAMPPGAVIADEKDKPLSGDVSFFTLNAGRHTIPSGGHDKIKVSEESWNANFDYLSQPGYNSEAFIRASCRFSEAKDLPPGMALFLNNGTLLGKKSFSLTGQDGTVFFGQDPLVTVTSHLLTKQDGIASDNGKKSYLRQWRLAAGNAHPFPVRLRIEQSRPHSLDKRIKITLNHSPLPSEHSTELLIWDMELAAGEKKSIDFGWEAVAPADLDISF